MFLTIMAQLSSPDPVPLPGIVTDQPEIFESEPALSDDTGVNDLYLINEPTDEAISTIDVPMRDAFSFFAKNEEQIFKKFYVQNYGEYKIAPSKPEEETDYERYNRLVAEVNGLLGKFQDDKVVRSELIASCSLPTKELTSNLEVLSHQLKALELAAEEGAFSPSQLAFNESKSKLEQLNSDVTRNQDDTGDKSRPILSNDASRDIKMRALERRLNVLETLVGHSETQEQNLLKTTKCESLIEVADTLSSWLSFFKPDAIERTNRELGYLTQRLEKINSEQSASDENKLDSQAKVKLNQLCSLVTATDKHRTMVPTIIHRLNAMEELQQKAAKVVTTMNHLEQVQSQIVDSLQWNKDDLTKLNKMFSTNLDHIKAVSSDIDSRIAAIRNKDDN